MAGQACGRSGGAERCGAVLADRPRQNHVAVEGRCLWTGRPRWRYLKSKRGTGGYFPTIGDHTPQPPWLLERGIQSIAETSESGGFHPGLGLVDQLYRSRSLVYIAGSWSDLFLVHVGLQRGCPLSPVPFYTGFYHFFHRKVWSSWDNNQHLQVRGQSFRPEKDGLPPPGMSEFRYLQVTCEGGEWGWQALLWWWTYVLNHLYRTPAGHLPWKVLWACPTEGRPWKRPRTSWSANSSSLGITWASSQKNRRKWPETRKSGCPSSDGCSTDPGPNDVEENGWIDGWIRFQNIAVWIVKDYESTRTISVSFPVFLPSAQLFIYLLLHRSDNINEHENVHA